MLPSIIAFKDRREAEHFIEKQGGELISFSQALLTISPAAMTMPVRIKTAAVPSKLIRNWHWLYEYENGYGKNWIRFSRS
jgi:hypothetical protein